MTLKNLSRRNLLIVISVALIAGAVYYGYEQWQLEKRNAVLDELIIGSSCSACSARKKGIAEKRAKQKEQNLIDQLNADQPTETESY